MYRRIFDKKYYLPVVIAIVVIVSSVGVLDEYSDDYIDDSILGAGITYAVARGINGIVSVLQTSTVQIGVGLSGSMSFGEVLDPINDLIERFSHVMSLAIGSLVLQKILLGISSHGVFKLLIAVSGFILVAALIGRSNAAVLWASRIFVLLIFVRFSLVIAVSLNSIADNAFIENQITSGDEELREFRSKVVQLKNNSENLTADLSAYEESNRDARLRLDAATKTTLPVLMQELADATNQLLEAEAELDEIESQIGWVDRWNPFNEVEPVDEVEMRVSKYENEVESLEESIEDQENLVDQLRGEIEDNEKRLAGEPVGMWDTITDGLPSISGLKRSLSFDAIEADIAERVNTIFNLSVLFILKTILMPLVFLYIFIKGVRGVWQTDLIGFILNDKKLVTG